MEIENVFLCDDAHAGDEKLESIYVSGNVKMIGRHAFANCINLREAELAEGVETIAYESFRKCGIRGIVIPKSVKKIERKAFYQCKSLEKVVVLDEDTVIECGAFFGCPLNMEIVTPRPLRYDERFPWFGVSFLYRAYKTIPDGHHCNDERFNRCAESCAEGDVRSMWELGDYFANLGGHEFYTYAANFWRYCAARKNFAPAKKWLEQWIKNHPEQRMPSVLEENMPENVNGKVMRYLGFLLFDENRYYHVNPADEHGVIVTSSCCCEDGPDESGFGREEYSDWWFLDENLKQIPGTTMVDCLSNRERFSSSEYKGQYRRAISAQRHI